MNSTKFSKYLEISPIEANKIEFEKNFVNCTMKCSTLLNFIITPIK